MPKVFKPTNVVLGLLCLMYFITYMDRVNISTAADAIQKELNLTSTQYGILLSAFAYPYLVFQVAGGWVGDKFGPRVTLLVCGLIWSVATILTGLAGSLTTLVLARLLLGFGEGATFPTATRAMQYWTPVGHRGYAQGLTHAFSRLGNTVTPLLVASLAAAYTWRGSFIIFGCVSLAWVIVFALYFRNDPQDHPGITAAELAMLPPRRDTARPVIPWGPLISRMWPVTLTYFCYGWCLWIYLYWLPLFFKNTYQMDMKKSAVFATGVFLAGVIGDTLGGLISDWLLHRTGNVRFARLSVTIAGFVGALLSLLPLLYVRDDITIVALCLSSGFFFAELTIGPMWSIPMDIAPTFSGTASGLMNTGSAFAAIISPLVAGYVIDLTGNRFLPFIITMGLLALGAMTAFLMHPERPLINEAPAGPVPEAALAGGHGVILFPKS